MIADMIAILKSGGGRFSIIYTDTDSDGYCGTWKWCISGNSISTIIFNDDKEASGVMNQVVTLWQEEIEKNEKWSKTVDEMDQLIITKELEEADFTERKEE
jgi:hypothetical protein